MTTNLEYGAVGICFLILQYFRYIFIILFKTIHRQLFDVTILMRITLMGSVRLDANDRVVGVLLERKRFSFT